MTVEREDKGQKEGAREGEKKKRKRREIEEGEKEKRKKREMWGEERREGGGRRKGYQGIASHDPVLVVT